MSDKYDGFSHIPSNILIIIVAFAPTLPIAIGLYIARVAQSQMDVPTRQSYVMSVVREEERTAAAGITNTSRNVAQLFLHLLQATYHNLCRFCMHHFY